MCVSIYLSKSFYTKNWSVEREKQNGTKKFKIQKSKVKSQKKKNILQLNWLIRLTYKLQIREKNIETPPKKIFF